MPVGIPHLWIGAEEIFQSKELKIIRKIKILDFKIRKYNLDWKYIKAEIIKDDFLELF